MDALTGPRRPAVSIAYRNETDLAAWNADSAAGTVPDRFPYGLHKLADSGLDVSWASVPPATAAEKFALVVRPRRAAPGDDWTLAWDEYQAVRMLARNPPSRRAAGVIWLTDGLDGGVVTTARSRAMLRILRGVDLVWVLSAAQLAPLRAAFGRRGPRVEHLVFGVAADYFTPSPLPAQPSVLSLGGDRDRDPRTLVRALDRVRRARPDVRFRVQVPDPSMLPDWVEAVPRTTHDRIRELYREASVVAVATRPNLHVSGMTTALEAMASARPIAMTATPGIGDYVRDGETGLLAAPGDDAALAAAILAGLEPAAAAEIGERGRDEVERRHTTDALARRLAVLLAD